MKVLDSVCFKRNDCILIAPDFEASEDKNEVFVLDCNLTVQFYYRMVCIVDEIESAATEEEKLELKKEIAVDILNLDKSKNITAFDIETRFNNKAFIESLFMLAVIFMQNQSRPDLFTIPDIKLENSQVSSAERALQQMNEVELMEGIVIVSKETNNSYENVLNMSFLAFQSFLKHIKIHNNISIPEWREKYLQEKYKISVQKENKSNNSSHKSPSKLDRKGLMKMGGLLNG